jgi:hypothetical protein
VDNSEAPVAAFASELGRQRDLLGVEVTLRLLPGRGATIAAVPAFATATRSPQDDALRVQMPPLLCGDTTSLVVALKLGPEALAFDGSTPWLRAGLTYRSVRDGALVSSETSLVPVLAAEDGPYVAEVARELAIQRTAELIHAAATTEMAELRRRQAAILELVKEAGIAADPQVTNALVLLAEILDGVGQEGTRARAAVQAAAVARGVFHREVTSGPVPSEMRGSTRLIAHRMETSIAGAPPPPPPKGRKPPRGD